MCANTETSSTKHGQAPTGPVCPECGSPLLRGTAEGLCPHCLLNLGLTDSVLSEAVRSGQPQELPKQIGQYEVLGKIAYGGMGIVARALQPRVGREVAVKIIRDELLASPGARTRFRIEAEAAGSLQHPNVVTLYEAGETDEGEAYFSMELVDGEALSAVLARDGPMEPRRAARILAAVADGVHHAHSKGILHRDLKPGNVLLQANDEPKVTDFGIALRTTDPDDVSDERIAGTPGYMAPEQAAGHEAKVAPATDVYGLGAILYEMLTGVPPFRAENEDDLLMMVLDGVPEKPRRIRRWLSRDLEAICLRCLEPRQEDRYASADELARDLRAYVAGHPMRAARGGAFGRAYRWLFQRPALALTYAALAFFYANQWVLFLSDADNGWVFHRRMSLIVLVWAAAATVMQLVLDRSSRRALLRYLWTTLDVILLTVVLLIADGPKSPLVPVYLVIIIATGFRWRPGLTLYSTLLSIGALLALVVEVNLNEARASLVPALDEVLVPITAMIVVGLISAALVKRMRVLAGFR